MNNSDNTLSKTGFTLVESVFSILLFSALSIGIAQMTMVAYKVAHHNVFKTSAYSVMLGYIEQIKSLDGEDIIRAVDVSVASPISASEVLGTKSISLLSDTVDVDEIDDWLVPNTADPTTLSDTLDVINHKQVLIDIDDETGERQTMDLWIDIEIHPIPDSVGRLYLIDAQFIFSVPVMGQGTDLTRTTYTRTDSKEYVTSSQTIRRREGFNDGRIQLVTSILNFQTL